MKSITLTQKDIARFWRKVKIGKPEECWECIPSVVDKYTKGYARIGVQGKLYLMHRLSWMIRFGEIPENLEVLHECDNRSCVNPNHLFLGTQLDNMRDAVSKQRQARGEMNPKSKLKEKDVVEIRLLLNMGFSTRKIAKIFGVDGSSISRIKTGRVWNWVEGD